MSADALAALAFRALEWKRSSLELSRGSTGLFQGERLGPSLVEEAAVAAHRQMHAPHRRVSSRRARLSV